MLRVLGVAGGLDLFLVSAGEGDAEHAEQVAIEGLSLHKGLNERVPLLDQGAKLVAGHVESVEVGVAVHALHFFNLELDLSPGILVVFVLQVSERDFENAATERVSGDF